MATAPNTAVAYSQSVRATSKQLMLSVFVFIKGIYNDPGVRREEFSIVISRLMMTVEISIILKDNNYVFVCAGKYHLYLPRGALNSK